MNNWQERTTILNSYCKKDELTVIPQLDSSFDIENIINEIRDEAQKMNVNEIYIMDPYFSPSELDFIIQCFAQYSDRKINIITRLEHIPTPVIESSDDEKKTRKKAKEESEELFSRLRENLETEGIFESISIYKAKYEFHDRYIFAEDDIDKNFFFSIGSSFNSIFKGYSNIIRITDVHLKKQVVELKNHLIKDVPSY